MDTYREIMTDWNNDDSCTLTSLPVCDLSALNCGQTECTSKEPAHSPNKMLYATLHGITSKRTTILTHKISLILAM